MQNPSEKRNVTCHVWSVGKDEEEIQKFKTVSKGLTLK